MIETLLNFGGDAKSSQLTMAMFYKDTPGKMDAVNPVADDDDANMDLKAHYAFTKQSETVDMIGPIHSDIFFQDRLILNGVNLRLKLNRAKNSFCLVSSAGGANHKVVITEAILYVRKVKVAPSIALGHAAALKQATAKYPIRRVYCKVLSIPNGFSSFTADNLFLGHIPKCLVLVLVDTEAYNGTYTSNPFNFKHHSLTQVGVYVDGEQIPRKPLFLKSDVAGGQNFIAGFQSIFSGTGKLSQDMGNQIDRSDYGSGYTAFCFDLSPDHCASDHFELIKQGNLKVELHFAQPLTNTVNLIIYAEFQNVIEIDASRNVCTITQTNMDTIQLTIILRKDRYTRGVFQGVYSSDKLPTNISSYPALFIANVDTSNKPGTHWVAFYFTKEREGEFFDSYGLPPSNYTRTFSSFLNNNSNGEV